MDILQRMPWMAQDSVFKKLAEIAEVSSLSKEDRIKYDDSLRKFRDTIIVMEGQFMEGEKKGRAEGRAEGLAEGRAVGLAEGKTVGRAEGLAEGILQTARNLKAMGLSTADIAKATGLEVSKIESL